MRKHVKTLLWHMAALTRLQRPLLRGKACILGFHRIISAAGFNGLNCSPELFDELCGFLKRRFHVVSLEEMVAGLQASGKGDGAFQVAITFDDGYRDNFLNAAPILQKHGLPAVFFLTTDFLGAEEPPFWDAAAGERHPFMSWNEARALLDMGFAVGSHTCSHLNLAQAPLDVARREIRDSKQRLEQELQTEISLFAYPFGGKADISPEATQAVADAGYSCCCGLAGELVTQGADAFHLERVPMSDWYLSPGHFGGDMLVQALKSRLRPQTP